MVQKLDDLDRLLEPVAAHFGAEKRRQVECILKRQARLELKAKAAALTPDTRLRIELNGQVEALRGETDDLRRGLVVYCMTYVRSILPSKTEPLWARLGQTLDTQAAVGPSTTKPSLWSTPGEKMDERESEGGRAD
jgi:hypothetical protein